MSRRALRKKKSHRVPPTVRALVTMWLTTPGRLQRGDRRRLARSLGVSDRLLRGWVTQPRPPRVGRPPHPRGMRWRTALVASRELRRQGWSAGWRPIAAALPQVSVGLLKMVVPALKRRRRIRARHHAARHRVSVHVHAAGALVGQDALHLAGPRTAPVMGEVLRDRGTLTHLGGAVGPPATGAEVVQLLTHVETHHGLPLALATDLGPQYRAAEVQTFLAARQVIWLASRPHTPQDNGATERGIRELRAEAGPLDAPDTIALAGQLAATAQRLNTYRRRLSRGGRTAAQLTQDLPPWYAHVHRETFYAAATQAITAAEAAAPSARHARAARREAIFRTFEQFGLVTRTRGEACSGRSKPEVFS